MTVFSAAPQPNARLALLTRDIDDTLARWNSPQPDGDWNSDSLAILNQWNEEATVQARVPEVNNYAFSHFGTSLWLEEEIRARERQAARAMLAHTSTHYLGAGSLAGLIVREDQAERHVGDLISIRLSDPVSYPTEGQPRRDPRAFNLKLFPYRRRRAPNSHEIAGSWGIDLQTLIDEHHQDMLADPSVPPYQPPSLLERAGFHVGVQKPFSGRAAEVWSHTSRRISNVMRTVSSLTTAVRTRVFALHQVWTPVAEEETLN